MILLRLSLAQTELRLGSAHLQPYGSNCLWKSVYKENNVYKPYTICQCSTADYTICQRSTASLAIEGVGRALLMRAKVFAMCSLVAFNRRIRIHEQC